MTTDLPGVIVGGVIGGGVIGGVASLLGALSARRKAPVERDSIIVDSASHVVEMLRAELDQAVTKVNDCGARITRLEESLADAEQRALAAKDTADRLQERLRRRDRTIQTLRERVDELERRLNDRGPS